MVNEVVAAAKNVRAHLGTGPAREAWDSFEAGFIHFHIRSPRYRLKEITGSRVMVGVTTEMSGGPMRDSL